MVVLLPGKSIPVLGRTRNFSGDVVFIWVTKEAKTLKTNSKDYRLHMVSDCHLCLNVF